MKDTKVKRNRQRIAMLKRQFLQGDTGVFAQVLGDQEIAAVADKLVLPEFFITHRRLAIERLPVQCADTMDTRYFPSSTTALISRSSRRTTSLRSLRDVYFRNRFLKQEWQGCYESIEQVKP